MVMSYIHFVRNCPALCQYTGGGARGSECDVLHAQRQAAPHTFSSDSYKLYNYQLARFSPICKILWVLSQNAPELISELRNKKFSLESMPPDLPRYVTPTHHSAPHTTPSSYAPMLYLTHAYGAGSHIVRLCYRPVSHQGLPRLHTSLSAAYRNIKQSLAHACISKGCV